MLLATTPALEQRRATRRKERGTFHRKQEAPQTEGITQLETRNGYLRCM